MVPSHQSPRSQTVTPQQLKSFEAMVLASGIKPEPFFQRLRRDLSRTPDPIRAANNFHRFLSSGFSSSLLLDFEHHPALQQLILELFAQSQYLADILVRDPELFRWLTASGILRTGKAKEDLRREASNALQLFTRIEKKLDSLKRFHRREILRIGAKDILNRADVVEITRELSDLADVIVEAVLVLGQRDLANRTGATFKSTLAVMGLGKLGGRELNFSSDIDLLFVYDEDGDFDAPQERIRTFHEYYNRLSEFVVRRLSESTAEGHLYRVDMRLRPEGSSGPLALSRAASLQYYEIRGEIWERQMLVKARTVAGNEDVGNQWRESLTPFVFPKTFLQSPLREISLMKQKIEQRTDAESNIKLGSGGIRDIEFVVQALQLLNGGRDRTIRISNTIDAIRQLSERGKLASSDDEVLLEAYREFRRVEHRLQLLHGAQTHSLPESSAEMELLARRLGKKTGETLGKEIAARRRKVKRVFDLIFADQPKPRIVPASRKRGVPLKLLERRSERQILELQETLFRREENFDRFKRLVKKHGAPDWTMKNFSALSAQKAIRRTLLQGIAKEEFLDLVVLICARSSWMANLLANEPLLFEMLAGQPAEFFREDPGWMYLREHDQRRYKQFNEFKILLPFLLGQSSVDETTRRLSHLADDLLLERCKLIALPDNVAVLALGKHGGQEITVGSDLDLVVVYQSGDQARMEDLVKALAAGFDNGVPYGVDFRLRPEGKNAPLAVELDYYREYLRSRASLWERQSLTKARVVTGGPAIRAELETLLASTLYEDPLPPKWTRQILAMRTRIEAERAGKRSREVNLKTGRGGLVDLEFLLQSAQLVGGRGRASVRVQNCFLLTERLKEGGILKKTETTKVRRNMTFLRGLETFGRLNSPRTAFLLAEDRAEVQALAASAGERNAAALKKRVNAIRRENRVLLKTILRRLERETS